jgi:DNA repair protein RAD16
MQWRNELDAHTDGLKVLVWHGGSRESNIEVLMKYDVVRDCLNSSNGITKVIAGPDHLRSYGEVKAYHAYSSKKSDIRPSSCFRKQQSGFKRKGMIVKEKSPLHQIHWNRIVVWPTVHHTA